MLHCTAMKFAKFFTISLFVLLLIYGASGFYFLPLAAFVGDLTRIAKLPESMFGWRSVQPHIEQNLLVSSDWENADVLVIGDSFSVHRIWQSVLVKQGLRVHTEDWTTIRAICEDFNSWLKNKGFKGKYVLIESLEHTVPLTFFNSLNCKKTIEHIHPSGHLSILSPITQMDFTTKKYTGSFSIGFRTYINSVKYNKLNNENFQLWDMPEGVQVRRLKNGCELFSHEKCQDALYFSADLGKLDMGSDIHQIMEKLNSRITGFKSLWIIVPDKSTVYFYPHKMFWNEIDRKLNSVNVLNIFEKAINEKMVDLYPGNDTHLSTNGYLLLGEAISNMLKN